MEDALCEFIDDRFLKILRLQYLIWNGDDNKKPNEYMVELKKLVETAPIISELFCEESKAVYAENNIVYDLENKIMFDFDETSNKEEYSLNDDEIKLELNVKNLFKDGSKEILVQIFEMNTLSYYRDKMKEFDVTMNLDGLNSKYKYGIPVGSQLNPYQIRKYEVSFPPELVKKRGVYIVDCILSGYQTRALIKIGDIKFIERITSAGHSFSFFDENNKMILPKDTRCSIFMDGHIY